MLTDLRGILHDTRPFREIRRRFAEGARVVPVEGAGASVLSFAVADMVEGSDASVLLVLPRPDDAELFAEELEGMLGEDRVFLYPSWELLPYEKHSPGLHLTAMRQRALAHLIRGGPGVVIAAPRALQIRVAPRRVTAEYRVEISRGGEIDLDRLSERLVQMGFTRAPVAEDAGAFARRGGILDVFPAGSRMPFRVEMFGDEIDSIREYDPESQRSIRDLDAVELAPQREFPLPDEAVRRAQEAAPPGEEGDLLGRGAHFEGIERWLPLLFPDAETLFDYLPAEARVVLLEEREAMGAALEMWEEAERFFGKDAGPESPPPPAAAFLDARSLEERIRSFPLLSARRGSHGGGADAVAVGAIPSPPFLGRTDLLQSELRGFLDKGNRVWILCDNQGQADRLAEILEPFEGMIAVGLGRLRRGFLLPGERIVVLADHEIFRRLRRRRLDRRRPRGTVIDSYLSLKTGDYVVHAGHGIGRFQGIERIEVEGTGRDCVVLAYAGGDRLYVPVDQMNLLQKYSGADAARPSVDRIGGTGWEKTRAKAKRAVRHLAKELLRLYATRRARPGFAFSADGVWQRELEDSFLYEETEHQARAVREVKRDMESTGPMDRLVCGDVGYGKTEVAVRAAFKAVLDGRQVAVLVPTTLLAHQHLRTFSDRFAGFPVRVEALSRFRRPAETREVREGLARGSVDVVIGTHRLLQKDIVFRDLGLIVVDEEQRFGVAQKEKLKRLRETVDVLTLTATPIPRTLYMGLAGARDISIIDTPPKDRLPIITEVIEFDPNVISAAILRELDRGGQVYFVHNRVRSIGAMAAFLGRLVPEARIGVGHGQMAERQLEGVMLDFLERKIDVLVSTMIIESGLDIPSVNTMLVNRADRFGLAQLYQLRGRVGRSRHRAYTYLLVPKERAVTEDARKRLEAIATYTDLGSGYRIARKDLEIRGAGNLLGAEQHGFAASVGFEMYCKLLEEAVRELRGEEGPARRETRLEASADSYLPDDYVGDPDLKVILYRRLAETSSVEEVERIRDEAEDRFGRLPPEAKNLFDLRGVKLLGEAAGAETIRLDPRRIRIRFPEGAPVPPEKVRALVRSSAEPLRFDASRGLLIEIDLPPGADPAERATKVLAGLV
ncbi:MAG: transcription-repair coupling factor [Candidatus Eisenbacteria bacterium]|nr:transcription-repair coupling factor [Candidatus Eisenbacteria bacterium]